MSPLKITRIETIPIQVPLKAELAIRSGRGGAHTVSPFLLVKVHTNEGLTGLGEASCTPRWSGEDPRDVGRVAAKFRLAFAANYFTRSAVEMALWDLAGKAAGKPVYQLLGGKVREYAPTKWSVSGVAPAKAADIASWALAQGFKAMKVKVGLDPAGDFARVKAVREAVGDQIKLGVDANGGWSPDQAGQVIEQL